MKKHCTAIVLAAGQGKRMGTKEPKQYLEVEGHPILYYALKVFEDSAIIDDMIVVTSEDQIDYCNDEIIKKYDFRKVKAVIPGGAERYLSVWNALLYIEKEADLEEEHYIFIHDGARPFVEETILARVYENVQKTKACIAAMPVKDTIKIADEEGRVQATPDRNFIWMAQTPQVFERSLITRAYSELMQQSCVHVTDDATVVEQILGTRIQLVEGSYENIKITTPEDMEIARIFLKKIR